MAAVSLGATSVRLDAGDVWLMTVLVTSDTGGYPIAAVVTVALTDPAGVVTAPAAEALTRGVYQAAPTVAAAGRWVAKVDVTGHGVVTLAALVEAVVPAAGMVTVAQVLDYLGETSATTDEVTGALAAEQAAQYAACRVPAVYPADLAEALKRRVARNLAARSVPVAQFTSFDGGATSTRVPMTDPEVARLERPWRRLVVG